LATGVTITLAISFRMTRVIRNANSSTGLTLSKFRGWR
jgi:hypothetical protein